MSGFAKNIINRTLSFRISLLVVSSVAILLLTALFLVLGYSYKVVKKEAELNANETLDYTIQRIDNVLLSVEQSSGNLYWEIVLDLDQPQKMHTYARKLVETNPYVIGCAIAMKPYYYKDNARLFMAYYYKKTNKDGGKDIVRSATFSDSDYDTQEWYLKPMQTGTPCWIDPIKTASKENEAITTFSLPLYDKDGKVVGVLGVDVSTVLLSDIIHDAKPTPNSYAVLTDKDGLFLIYPDSSWLFHQDRYEERFMNADATVKETAMDMRAGKTGYRLIHTSKGDYYVFYKPFTRSEATWRVRQDLNWSAAVVFPEDDIVGDINHLRNVVILIAIIGLLLLFILCRIILHHLLSPLRILTRSATRIARGQYNETIPDNAHSDEVGTLQKNFRRMQLSLSEQISKLNNVTATLQEKGKGLEETYEKAKEAENMKTAVLHNMTNKMLEPVNTISSDVEALRTRYQTMSDEEAAKYDKNIQKQSKVITKLLDELLKASQV